jgi:hypothetical protein
MLTADDSRARPAFALLVILAVVLLACGEAPPAIETSAAPAAPAAPPGDGRALPVAPSAAPPAADAGLAAPQVIALDPPLGATGVDPGRTTLTATFDRAMDPEGWAWVTESPASAPEIGESRWDDAVRVHTAEVNLEPGRTYVVWLNSPQYSYFRDTVGRTLPPLRWSFSTADATPAAAGVDPVSAHR